MIMVYLFVRKKGGDGCCYGVVINIIYVDYQDYSVNEIFGLFQCYYSIGKNFR